VTGSSFRWGAELPELRGSRVELRALTHRDAPCVLDLFGDPEVVRFWSFPPVPDVAAAAELVREIRAGFSERRFFQWGVRSRDADRVIGTATLLNLELPHRRAEVGFAIRRSLWGQGYASEALGTLIEFAFAVLDLHRLEADVDPSNERSLRVLERQGFRQEGYLRERWQQGGEARDGVLLGLLRREWRGKEPRPPALGG
jgi:[ribosomal protein S5]-alanine N-acetyltransferase